MAGNVAFISISRYGIRAALVVMILSNRLYQCHGQWWFSTTQATPPSSSSTNYSSTTTPPSPEFQNNFQATPPSPSTSGSTGFYWTATPPAPPGFSSAATPPSSSTSSSTGYFSTAPPPPSSTSSSTGYFSTAPPPSSSTSSSTGYFSTAPPPPSSSSSSTGYFSTAPPPSSSTSSSTGYFSTAPPPAPPGFSATTPPSSTATSPSPGTFPTTPAAAAPPPSSFPTTPATPPASTSYSFPTSPAASPPSSSAAPATSTTTNSTTLIVTSSSFSFGPETTYTSVQDAIDAVPEDNTDLVTIVILSGTYTEKVAIPSTKPYITLQGTGRDSTLITYNDTANSTGSTTKSATFSVDAANFTARNLTFQNSAPHAYGGETGAQAVALRINGDMAAFYGCGFVSSQDTICDESGRHYFRDCYIEGNIDTIWGNGQSLYKNCEINCTAGDSGGGSITAQGRAAENQTTGFTFVGGSITGTGESILGRAYGLYSRVIFIDMYMDDVINPVGWSDWPTTVSTSSRRLLDNSTIRHEYYAEYNNTGPGANLTDRVSWMIDLTDAEAANFSSINFIDGSLWLTSET